MESPAPSFDSWIDMRKRAELQQKVLLLLSETSLTYKEVTSQPTVFGFLLYKLVNHNFIISDFLIALIPN
jgi:hypothetical protein